MSEKKSFSFTDLLNQKSKTTPVKSLKQTEEESITNPEQEVVLVDVFKLVPSEHNFYSVEDIEELADSIKVIGLQQNPVIKPIPGTDKYKVIAGHRRRLAIIKLVSEGEEGLRFVRCKLERENDEIKEQLILIYTNSTTRRLTSRELLEQYTRLKPLIIEYKKTHDVPGRTIELIAKALNTSTSQVERMDTITKKLEPELKEELNRGEINFSDAAELARLSPADQKAVYENYKETGTTDIKNIREKKEKLSKAIEPKTQETINPTITALTMVKDLLEKEIARIRPDNEKTVLSEYYRILTSKTGEIDQELHSLMGNDMFKECGGAAE